MNSLVSSVLATFAVVIMFLAFISIFGIIFAYTAFQMIFAIAVYPLQTIVITSALGILLLVIIATKWVIHIFKKSR